METIKQWSSRMKRRGCSSRGNAFQAEIMAYFERHGWVCDEAKPARRMIRRGGRTAFMTVKEDFFGAFDITALRPGQDPTLMIQATTDRGQLRQKQRTIADSVGLPSANRIYVVVTRPLHRQVGRPRQHRYIELIY